MTEAAHRKRLGELVSERRRQQRLSIPGAARAAGIDRETWRYMEAGTRELRTYNHAAVESTLRWEPGSIDAVLAGGDPKLIEDNTAADEPGHDEGETLILTSGASPAQIKMMLERYHRRLEAARRDALDDVKDQIELIRHSDTQIRRGGTRR